MIATEMPAAMRPYSMAVAPESSFRNLTRVFMIGSICPQWLSERGCEGRCCLRLLRNLVARYRRHIAGRLITAKNELVRSGKYDVVNRSFLTNSVVNRLLIRFRCKDFGANTVV